jgi:hypothetical protein
MAKAASKKKKKEEEEAFFTSKLDLNLLRKKWVKCYTWSMAL